MSLSSQVGLLATRVGTELKSIRTSFVPNTLRGPIGGVSASTGVSGTVTLDPALANQRRLTLVGDTTIALMAAGADGQRLLIEANASGGQRVLTFDAAYELSGAVTTLTFTIPSGSWAYVALIYRSGTWRLTSAEPQSAPDYSTPSSWVPADHGVQAWSYDPILATTTYVAGAGGQLFGTALKVSAPFTATAVSYAINTGGSGFTSGRNAVGLYNSSGTLLSQTADQSTAWTTANNYNHTLTPSVALTAGTYYVVFLAWATTGPQFAAAPLPLGPIKFGRSTNAYRGYWYPAGSAPTALPATRTTPSGGDKPMWVGLS